MGGYLDPQLIAIKITWDDPSEGGKDKVEAFAFDASSGAPVPTEAAFNVGAVSNTADLDQSLFDVLSYGGARIDLDEIRIGTTFDDVLNGTSVGGAVIPEPMTMLAVGMSLTGLGGYIRKRRRG